MDILTLKKARKYIETAFGKQPLIRNGELSTQLNVQTLDLFDGGDWEILAGTPEPSERSRYGTQSLLVTSTPTGSVQIEKKMNINALNKLMILDWWYNGDSETIHHINIKAQINDDWNTHLKQTIYTSPLTDYRLGWNRFVIDWGTSETIGFEGDIPLDSITAVRIEAWRIYETPMTLCFDRLGLIPKASSKPVITLTFDDGNITDYTEAMPYMNKYDFRGTSYVNPSLIGTGTFCNLDQLKELYDLGWDISSHGWAHSSEYPSVDAINREMIKPYEWLIDNGFYRSADHISYPFGYTNDEIESVARKIYRTGRTTAGRDNRGLETLPVSNQYRLRVVQLRKTTALTDAEKYVDLAIKSKAWLIFLCHDLAIEPTDSGWYIDRFQQLMDYINTKKIDIMTISEVTGFLPDAFNARPERLETWRDLRILNPNSGFVLTDRATMNKTRLYLENGELGTEEVINS